MSGVVGASGDPAAAPGLLVNIDVPPGRLAEAERFYGAAFGLVPGRRFGADGVELLGAPVPVYLLAKAEGTAACCVPPGDDAPGGAADAPASASARRHYGRHWTPVHLDLVVPDVEAAVRRATAAGAVLERPVATTAWGRLALLADPFGHGFCCVQFVGRGYDAIATPAPFTAEA